MNQAAFETKVMSALHRCKSKRHPIPYNDAIEIVTKVAAVNRVTSEFQIKLAIAAIEKRGYTIDYEYPRSDYPTKHFFKIPENKSYLARLIEYIRERGYKLNREWVQCAAYQIADNLDQTIYGVSTRTHKHRNYMKPLKSLCLRDLAEMIIERYHEEERG